MSFSKIPVQKTSSTLIRLIVFFITILIYAVFGYPTPDVPGLTEFFVGLGLVLAIGLPQSAFLIWGHHSDEPAWVRSGRILFIFGMTAPMIMAVFQGHTPDMILRDFFPFLFLLLPFFLYDLLSKINANQRELLIWLVIGAGLLFAFRGYFYVSANQDEVSNLDALYLVNAPTVLFAALYLSGLAIYRFKFSRLLLCAVFAGVALLPIVAMGTVLQRASFGALVVSGVVLWALVFKQSVLRAALIALGTAALFYILEDRVMPLLSSLFEKHRTVGANMRFEELQAVWDTVTVNASTALLGNGWGAPVQSPAVGGLTVNFTHSLVSAALLKSGIIGAILISLYLSTLFLEFFKFVKTRPVLALSLFWPFVIDIFLYASYKSLDFGLILMLIACYGLKDEFKRSETEPWEAHPDDQQDLPAFQRPDRPASI